MRDTDRDRRNVAALVAGDTEALGLIFMDHSTGVFRYAYRMLASRSEAEDVCSETFLRIQARCGELRQGQAFRGGMYRIARNLCYDRMRQKKLVALVDVAGEVREDRDALRIAVRRAVTSLPLEFREPIILCDLEELDIAEAACILDLTVPAMKTRLYKARRELRALLVELE